MKSKKMEVIVLLPIFAWVCIVTIAGYLLKIESSWVYGLMIPLFFLMSEEPEKKLKIVVGGAFTGLIVSYLLCIIITVLSSMIGATLGWIIPVVIAIAVLMLLRPFFPYICNNVAFLYMVVGTKDAASFYAEFWSLLVYFVVGGVIYLGGILLIVKTLQNKAKKKQMMVNDNMN